MKRFFKTLVNLLAVVLMVVASLTSSACGARITEVEVTLSVYDYTNKEFYEEDLVLTVELYEHLAPKTTKAIEKYLKSGYYDNAIFYMLEGYDQIMIGDLKLDGNSLISSDGGATVNIAQSPIKPGLTGEYEAGGTTGSDLVADKGSIGLWRSWYEQGGDYTTSGASTSGRATWFMPIVTNSKFDGYFCIFAQIDLNKTANKNAFNALESVFSSESNYDEYVIYYTGDYDETRPDENYGLTYHCVSKDYFDSLSEEQIESLEIHESEGRELVCYNKYTIKVPNNSESGLCGAKISSVKVK